MSKEGVDDYLSDPVHYLIALDDAHEAVSEERRNIAHFYQPNDGVEAGILLRGVVTEPEAPVGEEPDHSTSPNQHGDSLEPR